ncbi:efflux RND transporter periplasmic adaptor subunit [Methylococcus sp. EFPC2]|uniref:efflux RND transporter periplasmic adaptor subunit n=1 Tax=Methylococcus sp. EFPC2 TaxID=2812648 RepID=UPI001967BDB5|nr:efflux RND transporter periplasmic adaptor subunit [Methylococcus sp. EFPC2]QSA96654.1 efflux RND transporter periplasmic adaptor subunit [Methylococcus sp. EFPC2]
MSTEHNKNLAIQSLAAVTGLILLLVWMEGGFRSKTPPGNAQAAEGAPAPTGSRVKATLRTVEEIRDWPATVSARSVAQLSPKIPARILEIPVNAGDTIKAGQIVARLDAAESQARVNQARSTLVAAEAEAARAHADARRVQELYGKEAATARQQETAQAQARAAGAQVAAARAAIAEAQAQADEAVIRAPFDGTVVRRELEPGDLAAPGKPVLTVQTRQRLRLEVAVPASCASGLSVGTSLTARVGSAAYEVRVEEIAPAADPQSHTVLIKTGLDGVAEVQPGSFAWLRQACGAYQALTIPANAVDRSGQLESVRVWANGKAMLRHVRTGKPHDGQVEILSGLNEGDEVLVGGAR